MKRITCAIVFLTLASVSALWGAYTWNTSLDLSAANTWNPFYWAYVYPNFQAENTTQASNGLAGGYLIYNQYSYSPHVVNMILTGTNGIFAEVLGANFPQAGDTAPTGNYMEVDVNYYNEAYLYSVVGSTKTQLAWASFTGHSGVAIKSIWNGNAGSPVLVYIDNNLVLAVAAPQYASGNGSGVGVLGTGGDVMSHVDIGPFDGIAPNAVPSSSIAVSPFTNHIDLSWPAATDDTNGMGVYEYQVYRNGQVLTTTTALSYSDTTVVPDTTYSYDLRVVDYFYNVADTVFSARTVGINSNPPYPSSTPEGRRVGVRTTGAYWGASPENIDVRSGNLSFSIPLLTAQGRAGLSASFNLSYNSQNWRKFSGTNWNFDGDVGYGFGWRLLAGSITPVWNPGGLTAAYFLFMDSTGAEYRLDVNNSNVWSSKDSIYVYFDANTNILHFRNGSSWYFGAVSASTEADAGVMYPTLMQDTHTGNQINIAYKQSPGAGWVNSSARIATITDVRTTLPTYSFTYNTDSPPHLTSITSSVGDGVGLGATYLTGQALSAPDSTAWGTTAFANTFTTIGGTFSLTHNGSGELTRVGLPYGGYLAYDYSTATYSSGYSYREIVRRYLSKDGSTQTTYTFSHETSLGPDVHAYTILDDPGGVGEKYWAFSTSGTYEGLTTQYQGRQLPGPVTKTQNDFTWAQDAGFNSYISSTLTTADPGQSYQAQKKTTQTLDSYGYGNVTQVQNFDWNSLVTPAKTYTYTYLTGTGSHTYITDYVMNRMLTGTLTAGGITLTLATNSYDGGYANFGPGNLTSSTTLAGTSTAVYDTYGNVTSSTSPQAVTTTASYTSATNYAAPTQFTVGSLTDTVTYNSFLAPASNTGPNTDTTSILYVNAAKPYTTTSAYGLTTSYSYTTNTTASVVNGRWSRTTLDGLGRTIKVESGTGYTVGSGTVNQVDTTYDSCGCSPLGKLKSTSLPHAPGAGAVSTTYTYDGIGRTLAVQAPDGASTNTYSYQGNVVTVTDPAGAWKKYTSDAFGRLTTVEEPNPAGGSFFTTYTYDMLDHLTTVSMARPTGTQTRTFNYIDPATSKPGVLLRWANNPENGTVTYTYDSNNRLWKVTDAKNQQKVMTYDSLSRVTQVQRYYYSGGYVEDTMQRTNFSYDSNPYVGGSSYSQYVAGRLAAVQYYGGHCSSYGTPHTGCDLIQEWYTYNPEGAMLGKKLILNRSGYSNSLSASWTVDSEGRTTNVTYPAWQTGPLMTPTPGSSYTYAYDAMGRLNTMTDTVNSRTLISGTTYGVANEVLQLTAPGFVGVNSETRTYNSMFQLTRIQIPSLLDITYAFSPTQNNGKITSEYDAISGEQVLYTYDSLNRLASAQTAGSGGWGLSYNYDGFGNLTDQNFIKGSVPTMHVAYNLNNLQTGDTADLNGNIGLGYNYDIENRLVQPGSSSTARYAYDAANKRVWRGDTASGLDEISFWAGQKLATYQVGFTGTVVSFAMTTTNVYFGSTLISKGSYNITGSGDYVTLAAVTADRLGSIGKFYPYGVERPSATANDKEKFTGYFRDGATGLDYADQRYEQPGVGRFMTPDPYGGSAKASNPGTWNRYAYVEGDPVNKMDATGLCSVILGGITESRDASDTASIASLAEATGAITAYGYAGGSKPDGVLDVMQQGLEIPNGATLVALEAIAIAAKSPGAIDIYAFSGGASAFNSAWSYLSSEVKSRIGNVTYLSPGSFGDGPMPSGSGDTTVYAGNGLIDLLIGNNGPSGAKFVPTYCPHNVNCIIDNFFDELAAESSSPCSVGAGGVLGAPNRRVPYGYGLGVAGFPTIFWYEVPPQEHVTSTFTAVAEPD